MYGIITQSLHIFGLCCISSLIDDGFHVVSICPSVILLLEIMLRPCYYVNRPPIFKLL